MSCPIYDVGKKSAWPSVNLTDVVIGYYIFFFF